MSQNNKEILLFIHERIRKLKLKYMKKYLRKYFSRIPHNCRYNHQQKQYKSLTNEVLVDFDTLKPITVGICLYGSEDPTQWKGDLCFLDETAQKCPLYQDRYTKKAITTKFEKELKDPQIRADKYKDLNELYHILEKINGKLPEEIFEVENLSDHIEIDSLNNLSIIELKKLKERIDSELKEKEDSSLIKNTEFNFEDTFKLYSIDDLKKIAQMAVTIINQKSKEIDIPFDKKEFENKIWDEEEFDNEEEIEPDEL